MAFEMRPNYQYSRPAKDMEFSLEVGRSSSLEKSKVVKQKIQSPRAKKTVRPRDKYEVQGSFGQAYLEKHPEFRQRVNHALLREPKPLKNSQKPLIGKKEGQNDELVKHMSNLPSYLQQGEKEENIQGKALNFGVLDWQRLEKWNYKKHTPPSGKATASSSGTNSPSRKICSPVQSNSHKKQNESCRAYRRFSSEGFSEDVKQSQGKTLRHGFQTTSGNSTFDSQHNLCHSDKFSGRSHSEKKIDRSNRKGSDQKIATGKESPLSGLRKPKFTSPLKDGTCAERNLSTTRLEELQPSECDLDQRASHGEHGIVLLLPKRSPRKNRSEIIRTSKQTEGDRESFADGFSSMKVHSADLSSEIPHSCPLSVGADTGSEFDKRPDSLAQGQSTGLPNNALCRPLPSDKITGKLSQGKCTYVNALGANNSSANGNNTSERLDNEAVAPSVKGRHSSPNHRTSFNLGRIGRSLSFRESFTVPKLSSSYATHKSGQMKSESSDCHFSEGVHAAEFCSEILHSCPIPVGVKNTKLDMRRHSSNSAQGMDLSSADSSMFTSPNESPSGADAFGAFRQLDQEAIELGAVKGRHPSPNRRFSFSFGRMTRSLSFKEGSTLPWFNSTYASVKSGPVSTDGSDSLDNANRNKVSAYGRPRSSPLRRLLDPLLRTRATNPRHSAENLAKNLDPTSEVVSPSESLQGNKHEMSMVQALLQVGGKDGLPFFKLAVNNRSDILVAMKKLTTPGKDDTSMIYSFYSVCEIKKKSGSWINQGNKEKRCGFGYTMKGQMKVSSSCNPDLCCKDQFSVTESVLYGVDLRKGDQDMAEMTANRELAAIIVKIPIWNSSDHSKRSNRGKELCGKGFLECSQDDIKSEKLHSMTVILPGGVHSLPNGAVPLPLIERWKSGGSCDCGGWDIGCRLRVLTNEDESNVLPGPSIPWSNSNHFNLFNQGGVVGSKPILSLTPSKKGTYSVEFSQSISLLQAFSILVAVLSSQNSSGFSEDNDFSEAKILQEPRLTECRRTEIPAKVEAPAKYVPSPPPSPVGRV